MKVAVLLRGQARFSKYGAHLFHIMVKDRFPDIEFKIFTNTWKSISTTMTEQINENTIVYGREYNQTFLTREEIYENELKYWGGSYSINNECELFHNIIYGLNYLANDDHLLQWWHDHNKKYKLSEEEISGSLLVIPGDEWNRNYRSTTELFETTNVKILENLLLKDTAIHMHYLLGQVYSAGKSYELYTQYVKDNPDYVPDLIWSTRPDAFHWFENEQQIRNLVNNCIFESTDKNKNTVLVDKIFIYKNHIAMSDYNFYMRPDSAKAFFTGLKFDSVDDNLFSLFTKEKHHLISLIGSGIVLQHALWAVYARDCSFTPVNESVLHKSNILRPSINFSEIYKMPATIETFNHLMNQSLQYYYPQVNTPATNEMIRNTFKNLLDN